MFTTLVPLLAILELAKHNLLENFHISDYFQANMYAWICRELKKITNDFVLTLHESFDDVYVIDEKVKFVKIGYILASLDLIPSLVEPETQTNALNCRLYSFHLIYGDSNSKQAHLLLITLFMHVESAADILN